MCTLDIFVTRLWTFLYFYETNLRLICEILYLQQIFYFEYFIYFLHVYTHSEDFVKFLKHA